MKVRAGFVSNSSSSSFIIAVKHHNATEEERKADYEAVMKRYTDLIQEPYYQKQVEPVVKKIRKHYDNGEYVTEIFAPQYYDIDETERMFDQLYNFGVRIIHKEFE